MEIQYCKIGIDFGGTRIKVGLVDRGEVLVLKILEAISKDGMRMHLARLEGVIFELIGMKTKIQIEGIGLAFPGIVDPEINRVMETSAKYDDAPDIDLVGWSREKFSLPLKMDNDARLAGLGEWMYGAGKGVSNMVMLTLGTGIGTSVILDNRPVQGRHHRAGILGGHLIIDYKNNIDLCSCGKYGCVEGIASMWMIENKARHHELFGNSLLAVSPKIDWETIMKLSKQGDRLSILLKDSCLMAWGAGLVNLVHAYDPEVVVIGGGISHSGEEMVEFFRHFLQKRIWGADGIPEIRIAKFPESAAVLGAASLFDNRMDN